MVWLEVVVGWNGGGFKSCEWGYVVEGGVDGEEDYGKWKKVMRSGKELDSHNIWRYF